MLRGFTSSLVTGELVMEKVAARPCNNCNSRKKLTSSHEAQAVPFMVRQEGPTRPP